ncbi:nucleolar MIF4G domain-containing protein 1 [Heracleum sosnowskyi]|uniref:Nucleolar MIF4G domain-containing protein 1 n=1 Tax=Heracleum sosnowskyi TaxID=360622 RepID=A0AAD8HNG1_9APIA|nr:nucleolar MIF4G domain-containing protein 1 [Heracleum sosnowskyi]
MDVKIADKSRRERRKEARLEKNKKKFSSWVDHQQLRKVKNKNKKEKLKVVKVLGDDGRVSEEVEIVQKGCENDVDCGLEEPFEVEDFVDEMQAPEIVNVNVLKNVKRKKGSVKKSRFEEFLEMDQKKGFMSAEEDLELEKKLAKKLKVKNGRLRGDDDEMNMLFGGDDDGMNMLFEGFPSAQEEIPGAEEDPQKTLENRSTRRKRKKKGTEQQDAQMAPDALVGQSEPSLSEAAVGPPSKAPAAVRTVKYVAPHLRSQGKNDSNDHPQVRRRVRGLLNRLSESNVEAITGEASTIFRDVGRSIGSEIISAEVLAACSGGPRGNEQYAAVHAAFVAGMSCIVGIDFGAKLLASLARAFEDEYTKEDNLSLRNLILLFSYLYIFGVFSSDLMYDFIAMLSKRLTEVDVSIILTVLQSCGMKLRSDDPAAMKDFIVSVQKRVNELKSKSESNDASKSGKRMEFMLETICDIKNNKRKPKEENVQHTRINKWLQKLKVDEILIRGVNWNTLLDSDKKGHWWSSGEMSSGRDDIEEIASKADLEITETQKMIQLAAAQRMNTDARRAIFCIVMSGEDYIDTFEKLLRLDLQGKQDREIMRIIVDCCLQEKVFNKYYCVLASKLCSHDKNHKFTLQYCLWDHFKEMESMELIRSMHLSKFISEMLASFSISLAVLKIVDFHDIHHLTPKRIMHFRMLFEAIFAFPDRLIWNIFTRIAVTPEYETLRSGIEFFISKYVLSNQKSFAEKFKVAKKALNNVEGTIL